jgi:hypothetical protein
LLLSWPCQVPILFKKQSVAAMVEVRFNDWGSLHWSQSTSQ